MAGNEGRRSFGEVLRRYRERRGATQRQLADLSTVSVRAIRDLELGKTTRPRLDTVRLIADGLGLTGRARVDFSAAASGGVVSGHEFRRLYESEPAPPPPAALDELVGREVEVAVVRDLLAAGSQRLVTITGLAGVGKTRVALEAAYAAHASSGLAVLWSSDDPRAPSDRILSNDHLDAFVRAGLEGLREPGHEGAGELAALIGERPTLLVLDGYGPEQLQMERVIALLGHCRHLRVLATGHAPLDIGGERALPLAPLPLPPADEHLSVARLAQAPSIRLLARYIRNSRPAFDLTEDNAPAIADIARRLDGIPAALEAAAAWLAVDEPDGLLDYLRSEPSAFVASALEDVSDSLERALDDLDLAEAAALSQLGEATPGWAMAEAVAITGMLPVACARLVQRLLARGMIRPVDEQDRTTFQVLELVRASGRGYRSGGRVRAGA